MTYSRTTWVDFPSVATPITAARLNNMEDGISNSARVFNVKSYGAVGDGATNDAAAIQSAIDAASSAGGGMVYIAGGTYAITATLTLKDDVAVAIASGSTVKWNTGGTGPMFTQPTSGTVNLRQAVVGLGGYGTINPNLQEVVVFDLHSPQLCTFGNLWIDYGGATSTVLKIRCDVTSDGGAIGGTNKNAAFNRFYNIQARRAGTLIDAQGTASLQQISLNTFNDFFCSDIRVKGCQVGPWMDTNRFTGSFFVSLAANNAIGLEFADDFGTYDNVFDSVVVDTFPGFSGRIAVRFGGNSSRSVLRWLSNYPVAEGGTLDAQGLSWSIQSGHGDDGTWDKSLWTPSAGVSSARKYQTLTYSASMTPAARLASPDVVFQVTVTNGTAFTVNAPTNPSTGSTMTFNFKNASGGAMGAITWNGVFSLASAFSGGSNGTYRTISFFYNGTDWVEVARSG